jgi:hypothetical protein
MTVDSTGWEESVKNYGPRLSAFSEGGQEILSDLFYLDFFSSLVERLRFDF